MLPRNTSQVRWRSPPTARRSRWRSTRWGRVRRCVRRCFRQMRSSLLSTRETVQFFGNGQRPLPILSPIPMEMCSSLTATTVSSLWIQMAACALSIMDSQQQIGGLEWSRSWECGRRDRGRKRRRWIRPEPEPVRGFCARQRFTRAVRLLRWSHFRCSLSRGNRIGARETGPGDRHRRLGSFLPFRAGPDDELAPVDAPGISSTVQRDRRPLVDHHAGRVELVQAARSSRSLFVGTYGGSFARDGRAH